MGLKDKYDDINGLMFDRLEKELHIFPLQTIQSMSERWGKSRQNVAMWAQRDPNFPKQLDGIIEKTSKTPRVYPLHEVERFEQEKGLVK